MDLPALPGRPARTGLLHPAYSSRPLFGLAAYEAYLQLAYLFNRGLLLRAMSARWYRLASRSGAS